MELKDTKFFRPKIVAMAVMLGVAAIVVVVLGQENVSPHGAPYGDQLCAECHIGDAEVAVAAGEKLYFPGDIDLLCLRCHSEHLELSHPWNVAPSETMAVPAEFPLDWDNRVTCSTCHYVHRSDGRLDSTGYILRTETIGRDFCLQCHDEAALSAELMGKTVGGSNAAPVVSISGPESPWANAEGDLSYYIDANAVLTFTVEASDPDGTTPELIASNLPEAAVFEVDGNGKGVFTWQTTEADIGTHYLVNFSASDGELSDGINLTVVVQGQGEAFVHSVVTPENNSVVLVVFDELSGSVLNELPMVASVRDTDGVLTGITFGVQLEGNSELTYSGFDPSAAVYRVDMRDFGAPGSFAAQIAGLGSLPAEIEALATATVSRGEEGSIIAASEFLMLVVGSNTLDDFDGNGTLDFNEITAQFLDTIVATGSSSLSASTAIEVGNDELVLRVEGISGEEGTVTYVDVMVGGESILSAKVDNIEVLYEVLDDPQREPVLLVQSVPGGDFTALGPVLGVSDLETSNGSVTVTVAYEDANGDGNVDGYGFPVENLALLTLVPDETGTARVDTLLDIQVDEVNKTVSGTSAFALLEQLLGDGVDGEGGCSIAKAMAQRDSNVPEVLRKHRFDGAVWGATVIRSYYRLSAP